VGQWVVGQIGEQNVNGHVFTGQCQKTLLDPCSGEV